MVYVPIGRWLDATATIGLTRPNQLTNKRTDSSPAQTLPRLGIEYLKQPTTVLEEDAWTRMRQACVGLYKDLLLLEHFAVSFFWGFYFYFCFCVFGG